jgi:hypothetical protein
LVTGTSQSHRCCSASADAGVGEGLESGGGWLAGVVGVAADNIVAAQVGIVTVVGAQLPGDRQDPVAHGLAAEGGQDRPARDPSPPAALACAVVR